MPEIALRMTVFALLIAALIAAEARFPRRPRARTRGSRWPHNLLLVGTNSLLGRVALPMAPVAWAASLEGTGLLPALGLTGLPAGVIAFLVLDLAIYTQHIVFHRVPWLWRLHRMHHADVDLDVTSGLRFHPLEILLSLAIKLAVIAAIGAPPLAVLAFEVVLNGAAMFNHANLRLPLAVDRALRLVLVTPDMHRVHHSDDPAEHHRNFGFNLPWWDRLFGTYLDQPRAGHEGMTVGLRAFRDPRESALWAMWTQPFRREEPEPPRSSA